MDATKMTYNNSNLITIDEFINQIFNVEGVKVQLREDVAGMLANDISNMYNVNAEVFVSDYPYTEGLPGTATVDDLIKGRVLPHVNMTAVILITSFKDRVN